MELNSHTLPTYKLFPITDSDGDFVGYEFSTDHEIQYRISLTQGTLYDELPFGNYCYQVSISPVVEGEGNPYHLQVPKDEKVGQTVAHALDCFFIEKRNVVLYACYDDDDRKHMRERKFNGWYLKYMSDSIMKQQVHPDPSFSISVLYRSDNPFKEEIEGSF